MVVNEGKAMAIWTYVSIDPNILETWKKHLVWFITHSCKTFYKSILKVQDQSIYTIVKVDTKGHFLSYPWNVH